MQKVQSPMTNTTNGYVFEQIKDHYGFNQIQLLLDEETCINWAEFFSKIYRRSHAASTCITYAKGINYLRDFLKQAQKKSLCAAIEEITKSNDPNAKAIKLLDDFVSWLDVTGKAAATIDVRTKGIRKLFKFLNIKIDRDDLRENLVMPRKRAIRDEIASNQQIRQLLNVASLRMRCYMLVLCDSGLSMGDALKLRIKDFKFDEDPVRIITNRSKTGTEHETFVTNETATALKQFIANENAGSKQPDDLVFASKESANIENTFRTYYTRILKKAGLNQKIDSHKWYKFHLHTFRKRWFTKAINVVPAYVAHAMLGRKQYLDEYFRLPLDERRALYRKIAKHVGVFEAAADKAQVMAEASKLLGVELSEEKLAVLKGLVQNFSKLSNKDVQDFARLLRGERE